MENRPFLARLNELCDSNEMCSVYGDTNSPRSSVGGFVDFVSHDSYLMRVVNDRGLQSGFACRSIENIYRIETGGAFEKMVEYLFSARQQCHPPFLPPLDVSSNLMLETLLAAQRHRLIVRIVILSKESQEGWVEDISEGILHLKLVDEFGYADGDCMVDVETIAKINCDTIDLQDLKLLSIWHGSEPDR